MRETTPQAYSVSGVVVGTRVVEFNGVPLRIAMIDSKRLALIASRLRGAFALRQMPLADVVDALGETARRWQSPSFAFRQVAEEYLPKLTGYSRPVIARGLDHLFNELSRDNLWALLEEEFGDPLVLDTWRPRRRARGKVRAFGPPLSLHVIAGNIPGIGVQSLIFGLLVKSPSIVKTASDEPLLTALFAQSLHEVAPALAQNAAVMWWAGEETVWLPVEVTDVVMAYGSNETIEVYRKMLPAGCRFVNYGHRYSIALIAREYATEKTARLLAIDMAMYDQQGCLSPHQCWVEEGGALSPQAFAESLADALDAIEADLPSYRAPHKRMKSFITKHIQEVRTVCEMSGGTVYKSAQGAIWTVLFHPTVIAQLPALFRGILVSSVSNLEELPHLESPDALQAIGIAAPPERAPTIMDAYAAATGVNRFCPIGKMQFPPLLWHHDGRPNLTDLVRWVDWEE
ncbi:MAG: hypothetical protein NZT92_10270 [Abditibacteriales bacterium]|nr:hypothetical protein [Abditibacteriales bacterium]MDW8366344.1 acyl-CoA reductase [Abditibacteriales bacterium]